MRSGQTVPPWPKLPDVPMSVNFSPSFTTKILNMSLNPLDKDLQVLADEIKYLRKEIAQLKNQLKEKDAQLGNSILISVKLLEMDKREFSKA